MNGLLDRWIRWIAGERVFAHDRPNADRTTRSCVDGLRPSPSVGTAGWVAAWTLAVLIPPVGHCSAWGEEATGRRAAIATVHPLATDWGTDLLRDGGNAVDAAIGAALMLGVVDGHNSGLGGGCFILIAAPDGSIMAVDGRETAPAAARSDMYVRAGKVDPRLSTTGPLAIAVPGALAAYEMALRKHGALTLNRLLDRPATIAERGFSIDRSMAGSIQRTVDQLRRFPAAAAIFLKPDGTPLQEGDRLTQPDLARTYRSIARHGIDWFYRGPFAEQVERWMRAHGGLLRQDDFSRYRARQRQPVVSRYRQYTVVGFPPPSSGGVHVAQILNLVEPFDLRSMWRETPARFVHVVAEAMKLAFADRAYWLGDADYVRVPVGLIDKGYARGLAARIRLDRVTPVQEHGLPPRWKSDHFERHTTHIAAADGNGYWVAITATINTSFGSKVVVPGTGVVLNNEMDDFAAQPGVPNAFGLIGARANAIEPGKRPLSSMSPTIVTRDGRPVLTLGAAGGPKIITQVVLTIIRQIDLGQSLAEAVGGPRFHHQWRPDRLYVEATVPIDWRNRLRALGHVVEQIDHVGVTQAVRRLTDGRLQAVSDPRVPGRARGLD